VKFLVIGAGSIGRRHAANLRRLAAGSVTVTDSDVARLEHVARELGVQAVPRLDAALDAGPDGVLVCTPTHLHLGMARAAVEAGAHVLVEKPLAPSLDGVERLAEAAHRHGRRLYVGCNMRFHPGVATLRRGLTAGVVGRARSYYARFSHSLPNRRPAGQDYRESYSARRAEGGGVIVDGVHEFDYLRWLGGEVASVDAWAAHVSDLEMDVEDTAMVMLEFVSGAIGHVLLDFVSPAKLRGCEVIGETAVMRWSSVGKAPEHVRVSREQPGRPPEILFETDNYDSNDMYVEELRHFVDAVGGATPPLAGVADGTRALALALSARAAAEGRDSSLTRGMESR
jgi:predicted dehydrogenase